MAEKQEAGQAGAIARGRNSLLAALGAALLVSAGCSSQASVVNVPQPADPLLGVRTPPGMPPLTDSPPPKAAVGWNPPPSQQFGLADTSSTNNATLAGMSWQGPLGKPLAIDDRGKPQAPGQLTGNTQQTPSNPMFVAPNPNPKVMPIPDSKPNNSTSSWQPVQLNTPQPLTSTPTPPSTPTVQAIGSGPAPAPAVQTVGSAPSISSDVVAKQLQDRGVINQKLDQVGDKVKLTCYILRSDNGGYRILEAIEPDYSSAARAIIQQIDAK
jgi:hypothetical protein